MPSISNTGSLSLLKHKEERIKMQKEHQNLASEVYLDYPDYEERKRLAYQIKTERRNDEVSNQYVSTTTKTSENTASGIRTSSEAIIVEVIGFSMTIVHQYDSLSVVDIQAKIEQLLQDNPKKKYMVITDWLIPHISVILK